LKIIQVTFGAPIFEVPLFVKNALKQGVFAYNCSRLSLIAVAIGSLSSRLKDKFGIHHHSPNRRKFIKSIDEMAQIEVQLYISTLGPNVRKLILISTNMRYRYFLPHESILTDHKFRTL
jgi:hypothetical protein